MQPTMDAESFNHMGQTYLPELLGITVTAVGCRSLNAELTVQHSHLAPNGYLHAGSVVTLADAACAYACIANLPEGAASFTTIPWKSPVHRKSRCRNCAPIARDAGRRCSRLPSAASKAGWPRLGYKLGAALGATGLGGRSAACRAIRCRSLS